MKIVNKKSLKLIGAHKLKNYIYRIVHFVLKNTGILSKTRLLAFGEKNSYCINPLWITCDVSCSDHNIIFNHKSSLPFRDDKIKMIFSSHNLEHLDDDITDNFLQESYRVLKSGGELLIDVPDCEKIINGYQQYLESNDRQFVNELMDYSRVSNCKASFFDDSILDILKRKHPDKTEEFLIDYLNLPSTTVSAILSCYMSPSFESGHVPTIIDPVLFDKNILTMSLDDFTDWVLEHTDEDKRRSGGHVLCWYPDKLINRLQSFGFDAELRSYKSSRTFPDLASKLIIPDRMHRAFYSFAVSAVKK